MNHLYFSDVELETYSVCFLVPSIRKDEIQKAYLNPFAIDPNDVIIMDLHYSPIAKKTPAAEMKEYFLTEIVPILEELDVEYLVVCDSEYFKMITKSAKVDVNLGYVLNTEFGLWKVVYAPNYKSIFYDPEKITAKISQGINALLEYRAGTYEAPGKGIIEFSDYPSTLDQIEFWLEHLLGMKTNEVRFAGQCVPLVASSVRASIAEEMLGCGNHMILVQEGRP